MADVETDLFAPDRAERLVRSFTDNNGYEICSEVLLKLQRCIDKGQIAVEQIELFIEEVNSLHKSMAVTRAGGALAQISSITSVGLGILGITTGRVGVVPLLVIATAGLGVMTGSNLLEENMIKNKVKGVEKYLSRYQTAVEELKQSWDFAEKLCEKICIEENLPDTIALMSFFGNVFYR